MREYLFTIFGFGIPSHSVISALAILLGLGVTAYFAKLAGRDPEKLSDMAFAVILGGLLGARLWEVLFFQGAYYLSHPLQILAVWDGGMSVQGGLIGGILTGVWYVRKLKWSFWETADLFAPGMIIGQAIGRAACFMNGDAYGAPTNSGFGIVYPEGTNAYAEYGDLPLWPAEVFESMWCMVVFALLIILRFRPLPKGLIFVIYVALYSIGRFFLEYLRGDTPEYLFNWTAGQWTSVIAILVTLALWAGTRLLTKERAAA